MVTLADAPVEIPLRHTTAIPTSGAPNDAGVFEFSFRDERYMPFEGAGVISTWNINMPIENNYFDFASLSDVILHINYTSRDGGPKFTEAANNALQAALPNQTARLFSLKHEFPTEWYKFLNPEGGNEQELVVTLKPEHFPFFIRGKLSTLLIKKMYLFVESTVAGNFTSKKKIDCPNRESIYLTDSHSHLYTSSETVFYAWRPGS